MRIASSGDLLEKADGCPTLTFSFAPSCAAKQFCRAGSKALKPHWANCWLPTRGCCRSQSGRSARSRKLYRCAGTWNRPASQTPSMRPAHPRAARQAHDRCEPRRERLSSLQVIYIVLLIVVPGGGLEPPRPCGLRILSQFFRRLQGAAQPRR
jgi:hypothetical protein